MTSTVLEFRDLPGLGREYVRGAFSRKRYSDDAKTPRLEARATGVRPDRERLERYRAVCGFTTAGTLPMTWPQVLATPLHAALLAHDAFPLPMLGLVHAKNRITEYRRIGDDEVLDFAVVIDGVRSARSGLEFDVVTQVRSGGALVQESVLTALSRRPGRPTKESKDAKEPAESSPKPGEQGGARASILWPVPESQGREYAAVGRDWNPIHVHAMTAKLFGFKRAIAHGMWTLARSLAELDPLVPDAERTLSVSFRRPIFLPSTVVFSAHDVDRGLSWEVRSRDGRIQHLAGSLVGG